MARYPLILFCFLKTSNGYVPIHIKPYMKTIYTTLSEN